MPKRQSIDFAKLDLNLLKVFVAVMQERHLTRAADRINKSVAGTSHALRRLREELGDELFESQGRGMVPTRRALEIAPCIIAALGSLRVGLTATPEFDPPTASRLFTIDIPVGADFVIMPPLIAHAARTAPNVSFQVLSDRAGILRNELKHGETELAIDHEAVEGDGLKHKLLYSEPFYILARKGHPLLRPGKTVTRDLYLKFEHVGLSWTRTRGDSPITHALTRLGLDRRVRVQVPTMGAVPAVIETSDYVCGMSKRVATNFCRRWNLDMHLIDMGLPPVPIYLVWHERFDGDPGHVWLRDALQAACDAI